MGIKSAIFKWLGLPIGLTDSGFWESFNTGNTAGQPVTEQTILSLSAVWACVRLISESAGTLPIHMYERAEKGRKPAPSHNLQYILNNSPNAASISSQFWSAMITSMLLRGNAIAEIRRADDRIIGLDFLHPDTIEPVAENGMIKNLKIYRNGSVYREVQRKNILHIPYFSVDGEWGLSAVAYGGSVFGGGLAGNMAANKTFEQGLSSSLVFKMERILTPQQRDDFRKNLEKVSGSIHAGKSPLLEGGMDVKPISIPPKDAQLLESRSFTVEEICRWFGVDPSFIGHGTAVSNWGTGLEQKMIGFLTFTIRPILRRIEQSINKYLISDAEQNKYYSEFSIEGLLRADAAGRASFYSTMVNTGIFTRDEIRALENRPEYGGNASKLTIQQGFTTLESIGKENETKIAK